MTVINLNSLVLRGVNLVADVRTSNTGMGYPANGKPPAVRVSQRHTSPSCLEPESRDDHPDRDGHQRAGRSGRLAGVLARCSPALRAGRAVLRKRLWAEGGACRTAPWFSGQSQAVSQATVGMSISRRLLAFQAPALPAGQPGKVRSADLMSAGVTHSAATRGLFD